MPSSLAQGEREDMDLRGRSLCVLFSVQGVSRYTGILCEEHLTCQERDPAGTPKEKEKTLLTPKSNCHNMAALNILNVIPKNSMYTRQKGTSRHLQTRTDKVRL